MKNYYDLLGLKQECLPNDIKKAYRKLALKFHPDKNEGDEYFAEMFKQINEANEVLSNPLKRKEYDSLINNDIKETKRTKSETSKTSSTTNEKTEYEKREKLVELIKRTDKYWLKKEEEKIREEGYQHIKSSRKLNHLNITNILGSILIILIVVVVYAKTPTEQTTIEKPIKEAVETPKIHNNYKKIKNTKSNIIKQKTLNVTEIEVKQEPEVKQEEKESVKIITQNKEYISNDTLVSTYPEVKKKKVGWLRKIFGKKESNSNPPENITNQ